MAKGLIALDWHYAGLDHELKHILAYDFTYEVPINILRGVSTSNTIISSQEPGALIEQSCNKPKER